MRFSIQVSQPRLSTVAFEKQATLDEAIEAIFALYSEGAIMVWNHVYVPLSYKYDISVMLEDILLMLDTLLSESIGSFNVLWPSNTFAAEWQMSWTQDALVVASVWVSVVGGTKELLNDLGNLEISKSAFLAEWKMLLRTLIKNLELTGPASHLEKEVERMRSIERRIECVGVLYR